jgi:hypothetical protein
VDIVIEKPPSIQHLHETLLKVSHSEGEPKPAAS